MPQYFDDYAEMSSEESLLLNTKITHLEADVDDLTNTIVKLNVKVENLTKIVELLRELQSADAFKSQKVV